jgi:transposase
MENLRFSKHAKKRERGKFLSFWQMHWLFSQIQEAIAFQAYLHNIDFERVNTSYSSQRCSKCGRVTYLDFNGNKQRTIRDGKRFVCQNVLEHTNGRIFRLDADLNAARII